MFGREEKKVYLDRLEAIEIRRIEVEGARGV